MIVLDDEDARVLQEALRQRQIVTVNIGATATVTKAIVQVLANSSYVSAETELVPKSNIFDTKYSRQREWWNTPKKERRRKK
jgi:uncharacterized protein (UPF0254 family)